MIYCSFCPRNKYVLCICDGRTVPDLRLCGRLPQVAQNVRQHMQTVQSGGTSGPAVRLRRRRNGESLPAGGRYTLPAVHAQYRQVQE